MLGGDQLRDLHCVIIFLTLALKSSEQRDRGRIRCSRFTKSSVRTRADNLLQLGWPVLTVLHVVLALQCISDMVQLLDKHTMVMERPGRNKDTLARNLCLSVQLSDHLKQ